MHYVREKNCVRSNPSSPLQLSNLDREAKPVGWGQGAAGSQGSHCTFTLLAEHFRQVT